MSVQLFSPHISQVLAQPSFHPVHPQSMRTLFVTRWFFHKINMFLFLNISFPLDHNQNVRIRLEILSQTLYCQISLQFNALSSVSMKPGVLVRNVVLAVLLF
jgi:hypothetical protein